jgi:CubicO group peptidase (beta-lactamase class C family)
MATVSAMFASTDSRISELLAERYGDMPYAPGAAVLILKGDSVIHESYRGMADMKTCEPISAQTRFNIASVSKQFTVIAMLQQAAKGLLSTDDKVSKYFPEFKQAFWRKITLADLAGHTSGLPDSRDRSDRNACVYATDESSARYFPTIKALKFEPGTAYDYINPTFILIAKVIEQLTGSEFCQYADSALFKVAGMNDTYYFDPAAAPAHQAHGYLPEGDKWIEYDYGEETFFATRPDGGIYSTVRDMARWESALRDNRLLPAELRDKAYTPRADVGNSIWCDYQRRPNTYYGLGWFVETTPDRPLKVYHTGDNGGFQAYVAKYPEYDVKVIVLENRNDLDRWTLATDIENILIDEGLLKH